MIGGDVPFYDLCLLGQYQDSRGYQTGQYRDRVMLTAQAEYTVSSSGRRAASIAEAC